MCSDHDQLPGQMDVYDWMPDCEPINPSSEELNDPDDPEYRIKKCRACGAVYASLECFEKECKERFHPQDPWKKEKVQQKPRRLITEK